MKLSEACGCLTTAGTARVAIVLDASESARAHQADVRALAQGLVNGLPASVERSLYFLANPAPYPLTDFDRRIAAWFTENGQRASLIAPVYEALRDAEGTRVVVIGSGRIFDLEDWADTPQLARTLLVSLCDSLHAQPPVAEEVTQPSAQDLCRRLHDPPVRVEISGPGFMPTCWDNSGYQLDIVGGNAALAADRLENYAIALQYFVSAGSRAVARVTHASGARSQAVLEPAAPAALGQSATGRLEPDEAKAFCNAVRHKPFSCPVCGIRCSWGTLRCRCQGGFAHLVYPSVEKQRASGFVVLRAEGNGVSFQATGGSVLRLETGEVVVKPPNRPPAIYRFSSHSGTWVQTQKPVGPYLEVEEDAYAIIA